LFVQQYQPWIATALVAAALAVGDVVGRWQADLGALLPVVALLGLPLWLLRRSPEDALLGLDQPLARAVWHGLVVAVAVLLPFAAAFHLWQTGPGGQQWLGWAALARSPVVLHGEPDPLPKAVVLSDDRRGLAITNRLAVAIVVTPGCASQPEGAGASGSGLGCSAQRMASGSRLIVPAAVADGLTVALTTGPLAAELLVGGATAEPMPQPLAAPRSLWWLLQVVLVQLLAVALPEELFFRGLVQSRLQQRWLTRWRVLGSGFGSPEITAAALFALVHLVTIPAPHRLLVFFPGLLFGCVRTRYNSVVSAAVLHACCNAVLAGLQALYA
jgi:membrane protease YdiL (CAAX protease family)